MNFPQKKPYIQLLHTLILAIIISCSSQVSLAKLGGRIIPKDREHLDKIILRFAQFEENTLSESRNFVLSRCIELDPALDPRKKGVNMTIIPPKPIDPKLKQKIQVKKKPVLINYKARNVSATTVLLELAKQSKHDLYITSAGIIFCPLGTPPFPNKLAKEGEVWDTLYKQKLATEKTKPSQSK